MTGLVIRAGLLYFALTFGAGFVLGPIRILWLVPRIAMGALAVALLRLALMPLLVARRPSPPGRD